jgi:hypothetical protein
MRLMADILRYSLRNKYLTKINGVRDYGHRIKKIKKPFSYQTTYYENGIRQ